MVWLYGIGRYFVKCVTREIMKCRGHTKKGLKCTRTADESGFCWQHKVEDGPSKKTKKRVKKKPKEIPSSNLASALTSRRVCNICCDELDIEVFIKCNVCKESVCRPCMLKSKCPNCPYCRNENMLDLSTLSPGELSLIHI